MTMVPKFSSAPAPETTAKVAEGMKNQLKALAKANLSKLKGKPVGAKVKLSETKYLGTKQEAWTDDSYWSVPVESEKPLNDEQLSRLYTLFGSKYGNPSVAYEPSTKTMIVKEVFSIGD